jgi:hypothetical protein
MFQFQHLFSIILRTNNRFCFDMRCCFLAAPQENELASNMYHITLISTHHREIGKCNSDELYKIIESISPDVIFEELSAVTFDIVYKKIIQHPDEPLETKSIKRYLLDHNIIHIPVDLVADYNMPTREMEHMLRMFQTCDVYKKIENEQYKMIERNGFTFLNSKRSWELIEEKKIAERNCIESMINKDRLLRIWNHFYVQQENRDREMLRNIYNYSKEHSYDKAIFTVGALHRKSLIEKIQEYERTEEFKLNWKFHE